MKLILLGFVVCAACGTEPPETELEVDIPARTSGGLGSPITFSVKEADGTVVASGNSTGQPFRVPIQPGARLSIKEDRSSSPTASFSSSFTITHLKPGDHVLHGSRVAPVPPAGDMTLRFVGVPNLPLGSSYHFVTPCEVADGRDGLAILSFREDCVPAGAFTIHGYLVRTGPHLHTEIAVSGFQAGGTIDAAEVWDSVPMRSVSVRGLPPDASSVLVSQQDGGVLVSRTVTPAPGDVVVDLPVMAAPGDVAKIEVVTKRISALGIQRHVFGVDDSATAVTLDLGAHPLPWITGPLVDNGDGVTWTQDGDGVPDFVQESHTWGRISGIPPLNGGIIEVIGPPGRRLEGGSVAGTLSLTDCPDAAGYRQVTQDHRRACSTIGLGQVLVESILPATPTSPL